MKLEYFLKQNQPVGAVKSRKVLLKYFRLMCFIFIGLFILTDIFYVYINSNLSTTIENQPITLNPKEIYNEYPEKRNTGGIIDLNFPTDIAWDDKNRFNFNTNTNTNTNTSSKITNTTNIVNASNSNSNSFTNNNSNSDSNTNENDENDENDGNNGKNNNNDNIDKNKSLKNKKPLFTVSNFKYKSCSHVSKQVAQQYFNLKNCRVITMNMFGRSGNKVKTMSKIIKIINYCSGVSINNWRKRGDKIVNFYPVFFGTKSNNYLPKLHNMQLLELTSCYCKEVPLKWHATPEEYCTKSKLDEGTSYSGRGTPSLVFENPRIYRFPMDNIVVAHFRGEDIFMPNAHPKYTQPVCDHYYQASLLFKDKCVMAIHQDNGNPCLQYLKKRHPCVIDPPCKKDGCAYTYLRRAKYLISSHISTFFETAVEACSQKKIIVMPFCSQCPYFLNDGQLHVCTNSGTEGLIPWSYNSKTKNILLSRKAELITCGNNIITMLGVMTPGSNCSNRGEPWVQ